MNLLSYLTDAKQILIKQKREAIELLGFEGRNQYELFGADGQAVGTAVELKRGFIGALIRQFLRHWKPFDIEVVDPTTGPVMKIHHPFRFYFQRLEVRDAQGALIGVMEKQFSILSKKFFIHDELNANKIEMYAGLFRIWTYPLTRNGVEVASIQKKWGGALREVFTDADTFLLEFKDPALTLKDKQLLIAAALFIDLQYFEENKGGLSLTSFLPD